MRRLFRIALAPLLATGITLSMIGLLGTTSAHAALPNVPSTATAKTMLSGLAVATDTPMTGYSREQFPHWSTVNGACSSREAVLMRDGTGVKVGADCYPTAGSWFSEYDKVTVTAPASVDIDHMVPLAEAWRSGAASWTTAKREQFANDVTRPQLIAVSASSNRSKGDQDPAQWMPPNAAYGCTYVKAWVAVKSYWKLTVNTAEKSALTSTLNGC